MPLYLQKLQQYVALITFWQSKFNLISKNTVPHIWERHILDSLQIAKFITTNKVLAEQTVFDLGAGAGLPSLVLAIMDCKNTYYAIEANSKKCAFLKHVKQELQLSNFVVINMRIEDFIVQKKQAHVVVSRALTSLNSLLSYASPLLLPQGYAVFPKGVSWQQELAMLSPLLTKSFQCQAYNNIFASDGKILLCQYLGEK